MAEDFEFEIEYQYNETWYHGIAYVDGDLVTPDGDVIDEPVLIRPRFAPAPSVEDDLCNGYTVDGTTCELDYQWGRPDGQGPNVGRCRYHKKQPYVEGV